jgi:N-acetylglucosamine kinase-like BadF-type ATPase
VEAGGTRTDVRAGAGTAWRTGSVNPASVGLPTATETLRSLLARIRAGDGGATATIWLASASVDLADPEPEVSRLMGAMRSAGLHGDLVVSNDVIPLLLASSLDHGGVVAVCGTGSAFVAGRPDGPTVVVGSCEYLGSDEGSAFDLGLAGLRAAVRAVDGRGGRTALVDRLASAAGEPVPRLARRLAAEPFPKARVAALAPEVCRAWEDGDHVAAGLVDGALAELVLGVRTARDRAGLDGDWAVAAAGGVFTGSPAFLAAFSRLVHGRLGARSVAAVTDPAATVLAALARVDRADGVRLPRSWQGRYAWSVRPATAGGEP